MKVYLAEGYKVKGKVFGVEFSHNVYFIEGNSLEENIDNLAYSYAEGNFSCDCNKALFADIDDEGDYPCGDNEPYEELKLYYNDEVIYNLLNNKRFEE